MVTGSDFTPAVSRETGCIFHAIRCRWLLAFDCVSAIFRKPASPDLQRWPVAVEKTPAEPPPPRRVTSDPQRGSISVPEELPVPGWVTSDHDGLSAAAAHQRALERERFGAGTVAPTLERHLLDSPVWTRRRHWRPTCLSFPPREAFPNCVNPTCAEGAAVLRSHQDREVAAG